MDLMPLFIACAPLVDPITARALVDVESSGNPLAIGVANGALTRQPTNVSDARATAHALEAQGRNYSLGLAQINRINLERLGLTFETAFDACNSLSAMQQILGSCLQGAPAGASSQLGLRQAFSCYYSGNFHTGFETGYVDRVLEAWRNRKGLNTQGAQKRSP